MCTWHPWLTLDLILWAKCSSIKSSIIFFGALTSCRCTIIITNKFSTIDDFVFVGGLHCFDFLVDGVNLLNLAQLQNINCILNTVYMVLCSANSQTFHFIVIHKLNNRFYWVINYVKDCFSVLDYLTFGLIHLSCFGNLMFDLPATFKLHCTYKHQQIHLFKHTGQV